MKKIILLVIASVISLVVCAKFVKYEDAAKVAQAHYYISKSCDNLSEFKNIDFSCVSNPELRNSEYKFYIFDFKDSLNQGFVIVSSDDRAKPILAYSLEANFDRSDIAPAQKMFFDYYESCIEFLSNRANLTPDENILNQWNYLLNYDFAMSRSLAYSSPTLLEGITFTQSWPYNALCPEDSESKGSLNGHVPVGCAAIAACQVMKYYNWPPQGEGSKTHLNYYNGGYGNKTINFLEETYNWFQIPGKKSDYVNLELAKLGYHVGVAVGMSWGSNGSGVSSISSVASALRKYFRYSDKTKFIKRLDYSDNVWANIIKSEIDARRPIIYQGIDEDSPGGPAGHAWNCDGYQLKDDGSIYFHMNWGWGASNNIYLTLDNLVSPAIVEGSPINFNSHHGIVYNIEPKPYANNPYPNYVNGKIEINGQEGSFDDGSGHLNYKMNTESIYVLKPDVCGSVISLTFDKFNIADGDLVFLYEGEENDTILIEVLSTANLPSDKIFSGNEAITIKFVTKDLGDAIGWFASYKVSNCLSSTYTLTKLSGTFSDGSGQDCDYLSKTNCKWLISPDGASKISLSFNNFNLAEGDFVRLYKGESHSNNDSIISFTSENIPSGTYVLNHPVVGIRFKSSNESPGAKGWEISYASDETSIIDESLSSDFQIFPNPGNNQSKLILSTEKASDITIHISDLMGKTIATKQIYLDQTSHEFEISELLNVNLENGMYFISFSRDNSIIKTKKFIVLD